MVQDDFFYLEAEGFLDPKNRKEALDSVMAAMQRAASFGKDTQAKGQGDETPVKMKDLYDYHERMLTLHYAVMMLALSEKPKPKRSPKKK